MRLVIADTGPVNYLIQIGQIELLPRLFERVALPNAVLAELSNPLAPPRVGRWVLALPIWLEIYESAELPEIGLDDGETAAIVLAESLHADLLLMDEREGVRIARERGLRVTGTLGILDLAAERALVDLPSAFGHLRETSFRCPEDVMKSLLEKHR